LGTFRDCLDNATAPESSLVSSYYPYITSDIPFLFLIFPSSISISISISTITTGYDFAASEFYSYKNTMQGFGGAGGSGLFGPPPPPPMNIALRNGVNFGPPPPVVAQPALPKPAILHLSPPSDLPTPVIGLSAYSTPVTMVPAVQMGPPMMPGAPQMIQGVPPPMGAPMMGPPMMGPPVGPYGDRRMMGPGGQIIYG
jgi:hypothetical protein